MRWLLLFCFITTGWTKVQATGDSIQYLTPKDTIFLELSAFGEKIFEHQIAYKQTLFSLARFYGLSLAELFSYNPELRDQALSIDQYVKIPIPNRAIKRYKSKDYDPQTHIPVCYRVKRGDTLYRIAKVNFKMPVDTIAQRNQLIGYAISPGDVLTIGWMNIEGIPEHYRVSRGSPELKKSRYLGKKYFQASQIKREYNEQGVAFWQKDGKQKTDLYALHRKAPVNSIIAVTNPMKKRTVYAKVIGRIPENVYGSNVVIVISSRTAQLLGARDARFFCKVRYLK
ncbi:MAG: LysM peptidoglycan-binding domain-containing protein [Bacteroidota bacterium]